MKQISKLFLICLSIIFSINTLQAMRHVGKPPGGVIPYCFRYGNVYFLLAREAGGKDKGTWADFGGGGKRGKSAEDTAAREGHEETDGVFYMIEKGWSPRKYNPSKKRRSFTEAVNFWKPRFNKNLKCVTSKVHATTYFVDVTHQVNKVGGRQKVIDAIKAIMRHHRLPWEYREKDDFVWIDGNTFLTAIQGNGNLGHRRKLRVSTRGILKSFGGIDIIKRLMKKAGRQPAQPLAPLPPRPGGRRVQATVARQPRQVQPAPVRRKRAIKKAKKPAKKSKKKSTVKLPPSMRAWMK